jgi:hypothetical protein
MDFDKMLVQSDAWRTGTLWEERFKSVIVESGMATRTMAAYTDLNPVRAGIVKDPADYHWSSYGEAVGGGKKGGAQDARATVNSAFFLMWKQRRLTGVGAGCRACCGGMETCGLAAGRMRSAMAGT